MPKQKLEFFKAERCIKCTNSKCTHPVLLNTCLKEKHNIEDVSCPRYERKSK